MESGRPLEAGKPRPRLCGEGEAEGRVDFFHFLIIIFTIDRDDSIYKAWPDVASAPSGHLVCVFSECAHGNDCSYTRIQRMPRCRMNYTMSPKLNLLTLYAAGQLFLDPTADPDELSARFCAHVFGKEHAALGAPFEAFEVVPGWGHYPRRKWSKPVLRATYREIIDRLEAANVSGCSLPLFPDAETYRQDLLWFARLFLELAGEQPDRVQIKHEYWRKTFAIYDHIPMSVDERADQAATKFSQLLTEETNTAVAL